MSKSNFVKLFSWGFCEDITSQLLFILWQIQRSVRSVGYLSVASDVPVFSYRSQRRCGQSAWKLHGGTVSCVPEWFSPLLLARSYTKYGVKKGAAVDHFWPLRYWFLLFDCKYLETGKLEHHMSIRTLHQLNDSFLKIVSHVVVAPRRVYYKQK